MSTIESLLVEVRDLMILKKSLVPGSESRKSVNRDLKVVYAKLRKIERKNPTIISEKLKLFNEI